MVLTWLLISLILLMAELTFSELTALMLLLGALSAAGLAAMGLPPVVQGLGFGVVALGMVAFLRPVLRHWLQPVESQLSTDGFVGQEARVLEAIGPDQPGRIKIHGEIWNASAYDALEPGEVVIITGIRNNFAEVVSRQALRPTGSQQLQTPEGEHK